MRMGTQEQLEFHIGARSAPVYLWIELWSLTEVLYKSSRASSAICRCRVPEKLELAPDFWRKRAAEARRLAKLIEDDFAGETLLEIARQYDELIEHAKRRQRRR